MPLYRPPVKPATRTIPLLALIGQVDPDFMQSKAREPEYYEGSSLRPRMVSPNTRGAYNRRSNTYAVGQPYGALDTAIEAALAPTVGNEVPGLYEGVATGSWA